MLLPFSAVSLLGADVVDQYEVSLGTVEDFILDSKTQRFAYVIVASGVYLGAEEKLFAIPASFLHVNNDDETLIFDTEQGHKASDSVLYLPDHYDDMEVQNVQHFIDLIASHIDQPGHKSDVTEF